jgi:hypothetical protein
MAYYVKKSYTAQAAELGVQLREALKDEPNIDVAWTLTKIGKLFRRSCKNNTAFNNALSEIFPNMEFSQTGQEYKPGKFGLRIRLKAQPEVMRQDESGEDDEE